MSGKTITVGTPATDSTNNANLSDVIGSKADTPPGVSTAANATLSLAAYLKALWNGLRTVPATDSTNNTNLSDVIGSKADTPPATGTAANATLSLAGYIKAMWNVLRTATFSGGALNSEIGITSPITAASQGTFGSANQAVASTAHNVTGIVFTLSLPAFLETYNIQISTGAGAGTPKLTVSAQGNVTATSTYAFTVPLDPTLIPKGVRVVVAAANMSNGSARTINGCNLTFLEDNA